MLRTLVDLRAEARRNTETADRKMRLKARLRSLEAATEQWDAWTTNQALPPERRRVFDPPDIDRVKLSELRAVVLEELACLHAVGW